MSLIAAVNGVIQTFLSGCQSFINYVTDDMRPMQESERKTTFECRDISPPQLDNDVIRCREV